MKESTIPTTFDSHISISIISVLLLIVVMAALPVASAAITTYDFSSGEGSDKWARYCQGASGFSTGSLSPGTETEFTTYTAIDADDAEYYKTSSSKERSHNFTYIINENPSSITQLYLYWKGSEGNSGQHTTLTWYIWNFDTTTWEQLNTGSSNTDIVLNGTITSSVSSYITADGYLYTILVTGSPTGNKELRTNYVKVDVTTSTTVTSCNVSGTEKDRFAHGESVYVKAEGLAANASYGIWIQNYTVNEGATLQTDKDESGTQETVTTAANGSFGYGVGDYPNPVTIWEIPLDAEVTNHEHDIVVDKQDVGAGTYNAADDGLDSASTVGMIAPVPDVSALILFASGLMLAAVCFVRGGRKKEGKK